MMTENRILVQNFEVDGMDCSLLVVSAWFTERRYLLRQSLGMALTIIRYRGRCGPTGASLNIGESRQWPTPRGKRGRKVCTMLEYYILEKEKNGLTIGIILALDYCYKMAEHDYG